MWAQLLHPALVAPRPGFVYWSATFFPGWRVKVNGRTAAIRVANYAFRAVEVPAGPVELRFSYWPEGLSVGLAVSALCAAALAVLLARGEGRPQPRPPSPSHGLGAPSRELAHG